MQNSQYQLIYCTCPSLEVANKIAHIIVEKRLAACVNIIDNMRSVYRWQGKIISDSESLLLIKSESKLFNELQTVILKNHPYELPEVIAVSIDTGLPSYLDWISQSTKKS